MSLLMAPGPHPRRLTAGARFARFLARSPKQGPRPPVSPGAPRGSAGGAGAAAPDAVLGSHAHLARPRALIAASAEGRRHLIGPDSCACGDRHRLRCLLSLLMRRGPTPGA